MLCGWEARVVDGRVELWRPLSGIGFDGDDALTGDEEAPAVPIAVPLSRPRRGAA